MISISTYVHVSEFDIIFHDKSTVILNLNYLVQVFIWFLVNVHIRNQFYTLYGCQDLLYVRVLCILYIVYC